MLFKIDVISYIIRIRVLSNKPSIRNARLTEPNLYRPLTTCSDSVPLACASDSRQNPRVLCRGLGREQNALLFGSSSVEMVSNCK
jgi:hypothetical protein